MLQGLFSIINTGILSLLWDMASYSLPWSSILIRCIIITKDRVQKGGLSLIFFWIW